MILVPFLSTDYISDRSNTYSGKFAPIVGDAIKSSLGNRRALQTLVEILIDTLSWRRSQLLPTARAVIAAMESDPLTSCLQVQLAIVALPWQELAIFLQQLVASNQMNSEVLWNVVTTISRVTHRDDASELVQLESVLSASNDDRLRRIALAVLITQSQTDGWNDERMAKLAVFRNDPSALVAEKAQFTLLPDPLAAN